MKKLLDSKRLALLGLILLYLIPASHAQSGTILGQWKTIDDDTGQAKSVVEIYQRGDKVYGKIIELYRQPEDNPAPICSVCKGDKKDQPIKGMTIIENMTLEEETWQGGTILDPKSGKLYKGEIWPEGGQLRVRGYIGLFFRTQTWEPVE